MDVSSIKLLLIEPNPFFFGLVRIRNWTKTKVLCSCDLNYNNLRISRNFFNLGAQKNFLPTQICHAISFNQNTNYKDTYIHTLNGHGVT